MTTDWTPEARGTGAHAELNGLNLNYEIHGSEQPMILLHGGLGSGEMFGLILAASPLFAAVALDFINARRADSV